MALLAASQGENPAPPPIARGAVGSVKYAVRASASVVEDPARIVLAWPAEKTARAYTVYRRLLGGTNWSGTPLGTLEGGATGFVDDRVASGLAYEYRIDRDGDGYLGRGYLCAAIRLPAVEDRGGLILLVEKGAGEALGPELERFAADLRGDGWRVWRREVGRGESPVQTKRRIEELVREHPGLMRQVCLFGHVPVPYSGSVAPDGHPDHRGAWPADLYYGDLRGVWTDASNLAGGPNPLQVNLAGDGKFDQNAITPNQLSLAVGRVDLCDLPAFRVGEIELLRRYLAKNHAFRHGLARVEARGLIDDHFGGFRGEAFAAGAWRNFAAFFGAEKTEAYDFFPSLRAKDYLWAYGCGGGSHDRASGIGTTADFAGPPLGAVFTLLFGSYFGDWNRANNFMRAALANAGWPLACAWDGRPHWILHPMALGRTLGEAALRTQNNDALVNYLPWGDVRKPGQEPEEPEAQANSIHVALMGDPTLRMHVVAPPRAFRAESRPDGSLAFHWEAAEDPGICAYRVSWAESPEGPFALVPNVLNGPEGCAVSGALTHGVYAVKSMKLEKNASGTYWNASQAIFYRASPGARAYAVPRWPAPKLSAVEDTPLAFAWPPGALARNGEKALPGQGPRHGSLRQEPHGRWVYVPEPDYHGAERFTLIPRDALNDGPEAAFEFQVASVPDAPRPRSLKLGLSGEGDQAIHLSAENPDEPGATLSWKILCPPKHGKLGGIPPDLSYHPASSAQLEDFFTYTAAHAGLTGEGARVSLFPPLRCPQTAKPISVDGDLSDWPGPMISVEKPAMVRGTDRAACRFSFATAHDAAWLYAGVEVADDRIESVSNRDPWAQDGIELRIDARPAPLRSTNRGAGENAAFFFIAFSPADTPGAVWLWRGAKSLPEGVRYACRKTARGYGAEVAVPAAWMDRMAGKPWDGFRLNLAVNDRDGARQIQCWWQPDWRAAESWEGSGSFVRD
ncbi:MAG: hypothetical protein J0L75_06390 [Spirochaetes bacterium]|nr:hypothetical protein [Spirochaetota bacterium]